MVAKAVGAVGGLAGSLRRVSSATIVVSLLPWQRGPELGLYESMAQHSGTALRHRIKGSIARELEQISSSHFCDLDEVALDIGRAHSDRRLWEMSRFPFSVTGAKQ